MLGLLRKERFQKRHDAHHKNEKDMVNLIFDNLEYLQRFDKVKVYYDDGQYIVTKSLHDAIEYAPAQPITSCQACDLLCAGVAHQLAVDILAGGAR